MIILSYLKIREPLVTFLLLVLLAGCQQNNPNDPNTSNTPSTLQTPAVPANPVDSGGVEQGWSNPETWGGKVPDENSSVTIPAGHRVVIDGNVVARNITVLGELLWADKDGLELKTNYMMVHGPGLFQIGTAGKPFTKKATVTLTGSNTSENIMGMGTKFVGAMMGGRIEIYGEKRVSWTKLNATVQAGSSQLTLVENPGWRVGEKIVVASSTFNPDEAEERTITAINGLTLSLNKPLKYRHYGDLQTFDGKTLDSRAEVGLLSRNIVIQGDESSVQSKFGGHIMIMGSSSAERETNPAHRSSAKVRGVELRRMGQFNRLGRYPFHWHRNGGSNGDFLEDSAIYESLLRGVVVHGTDGVLVKDNVVYKTPGHSYIIEDGTERSSIFEKNLGLLPRAVTLTADGLKDQNDQAAAVFWLRTAAATLVGNSAAGGNFSGYWFDMGFIDGNNTTKSQLVFRDNSVHSHKSGRAVGESDAWAIWHTDGFVPSEEGVLRLERVTAYKNERAIETKGRGVVTDSVLADNGTAISQLLIKDSVVVSRSANRDKDEQWGAIGMFAYGGFGNAENVTWVGFRNGRRISSTLACGIEYPRFSNKGAKMMNSDPAAGCGDVIMTDIDGSLSGTGRAQKLIAVGGRPGFDSYHKNRFGLLTSACKILSLNRPDGVAVCPNYDYRTLGVTYPTGPTEPFANDTWQIDVVRDEDGHRMAPEHFRWVTYVIPGKVYRLEVKSRTNPLDTTVYSLKKLKHISLSLSTGDLSNPDLLLGGRDTVYDPTWNTRTLTVYAAAPVGNYRIRRCSYKESCDDDPAKWTLVNASANLAALQAASGAGYALENGRIYFKLRGGDQLRFEW